MFEKKVDGRDFKKLLKVNSFSTFVIIYPIYFFYTNQISHIIMIYNKILNHLLPQFCQLHSSFRVKNLIKVVQTLKIFEIFQF